MNRSAVVLAFLFFAVGFSSAQQSDLSLSAIGAFTGSVTGNGIQETATDSGGGLLSYRHFAHEHNGIEANYSYTKNSQRFTYVSGAPVTDVQTNVQELTAAYVFHVTRGSLQPYALAGGGLLTFSPTSSALQAALIPALGHSIRPVFLYGAGLDYRIRKSLAVRAGYRGLVCESPDFFGQQYALHTSKAMQIMEPTVGLVYRF
jgi:opacity protein-like surface antigen